MIASYSLEIGEIRKKATTAAAWLSSARSVRSALKWDNERNPCLDLLRCIERLPRFPSGRKERQTSSHHGAYILGCTHPTMDSNNGLCHLARGSKSLQTYPQWGLRAETRPHEHGIRSNRGSSGRGEYVLGSCTHRPSSHQSWKHLTLRICGKRVSPAMGTKS